MGRDVKTLTKKIKTAKSETHYNSFFKRISNSATATFTGCVLGQDAKTPTKNIKKTFKSNNLLCHFF